MHWDLICDLRKGGAVDADGETILEDGAFRTRRSCAASRSLVVLLAGAGQRARSCARSTRSRSTS